jgi:fructose-1,6-bisphosphatase/inositol monophosphatase family enzyme
LSHLCHAHFTPLLWVFFRKRRRIWANKKATDKEVTGMVAQMREEYVTAGLRQQIETLKILTEEMEKETIAGEALSWRIRAIELQLKRLRETA